MALPANIPGWKCLSGRWGTIGRLTALPVSIRPAWKDFSVTNTGGRKPTHLTSGNILIRHPKKSHQRSTMRLKIRMLVRKIQMLAGLFSTHWTKHSSFRCWRADDKEKKVLWSRRAPDRRWLGTAGSFWAGRVTFLRCGVESGVSGWEPCVRGLHQLEVPENEKQI